MKTQQSPSTPESFWPCHARTSAEVEEGWKPFQGPSIEPGSPWHPSNHVHRLQVEALREPLDNIKAAHNFPIFWRNVKKILSPSPYWSSARIREIKLQAREELEEKHAEHRGPNALDMDRVLMDIHGAASGFREIRASISADRQGIVHGTEGSNELCKVDYEITIVPYGVEEWELAWIWVYRDEEKRTNGRWWSSGCNAVKRAPKEFVDNLGKFGEQIGGNLRKVRATTTQAGPALLARIS